MVFLYIGIFIASCFLMAFSGKRLLDSLSKIAQCLGWKEFVVAFFIMAFGASVPNFFVGIFSALNHVPQLSLGDVVGGNIICLSLVIGLTALISRGGLSAPSRTVQGSSIFTIGIAILPLLLISDPLFGQTSVGTLSRIDAIFLFIAFFIYIFWLFGKKERFEKVYDCTGEKLTLKFFFQNFLVLSGSLILLAGAAFGIVTAAKYFASFLNFPITLIGILIVGMGSAMPEIFFSFHAARKGKDWMILGNLMGGVVITSTLVLGIVAMINPIEISNFSAIAIGRAFLVISAVFFLLFMRTGQKITKKEGILLVSIYIAFLLTEIFVNN